MSTDACLALLLDAPMQSWGHASRFERRTTALHPTRSGIFGLLAAALGINKHADDEATKLARYAPLHVITVTLPRHLGFFEKALADSPTNYLAGSAAPTVADIFLAITLKAFAAM